MPDHSSLTRIRERYGLEVFRNFFEKIVELCIEAGLIKGDELFFDSTTVKADAARSSLVPRLFVLGHVEELFENAPIEQTVSTPKPPRADATLPTAEDPELKVANEAQEDFISSIGRRGAPSRVPNPHLKRSGDVVSRTDPDARLAGHIKASAKMGYKAHYVVDGGKARVIVNALVTRADLQDNQPTLDLLWRTCFRWRLKLHHVTGDSVYGTLPNVKAVEQAGIRAYTPIIDYTRGKRLFNKEEFVYDDERDLYVCPAGELLKKDGIRFKQQITRYIANPDTCNACLLKVKCTDGKSGRAVARSFDEEYYDRVRSYRGTFAYEKALRKRKVWIEPLFAEAKEWHGMREVRLRTLERVNAEVLVIASGQNVKRLLEFGGRGPKKVAQAAALRPPERARLRYVFRHRAICRAFFNMLPGFMR